MITSQPVSPPGCLRGVQLSFSLGVTSSASSPLTYQWRRNGLDIDDVPGSVAGVHTPELTVLAASANTGVYDVVAATPEGCVTSATTTLSACPADFDCSGTLNVQDIMEFLSAWFADDPRADFDGFGGLTITDVRSFIYAWFRGC